MGLRPRQAISLALLALALLTVGTPVCLPGLGLVARLVTLLLPGWAAPSFYNVVVVATAREGADLGGTVDQLVAAGVRPPQILLLNAADPPQQLADFYLTFGDHDGVRALKSANRLRRPGAAANRLLPGLAPERQRQLAECIAVNSAAEQVLDGATRGRWDAEWVVLLADDGSLRLRPGAGYELGAVLRGYGGCSRGVVALAGEGPNEIGGYAFRTSTLPKLASDAQEICTAWATAPAQSAAAPPTLESVLKHAYDEITAVASHAAPPAMHSLTYRVDAPAVAHAGKGRKKGVSDETLRCPSSDEMRVMGAI